MHALKSGFASIIDHPVWQAAMHAPVVAETDDEREAVAAALESGPLIPGSQVSAEIAHRTER